jgi:hypothetical protein
MSRWLLQYQVSEPNRIFMPMENTALPILATTKHDTAVSWNAVFAGAAAAAALSLILLILGTGLGLSSVSPWSSAGISAATFGISTILWITITQVIASGMGGYLAGRLGSGWSTVKGDEVYFRDTAHGFLAWAVATLITAALLTSVVGTIIGGTAKVSAATATSAAPINKVTDSGDEPNSYILDALFRGANAATPDRPRGDVMAEVSRILLNAMPSESISITDTQYVAELISQRTGLSQPVAEKRVAVTFDRLKTKNAELLATTKNAANKARKATAYSALWLFISLLMGAFAASYFATYGAKRRDFDVKFN